MAEKWEIEGRYIMACNCDFGCPCNFNARPSTGSCEGVVAFVVERGRYGEVALDGAKAAAIVSWPGAIHEGNGRGVLYVDDSAGDEQREAMRAIMTGDVGGPFGTIMSTTLSSFEGPHFVPFSVDVSGKDTSLSAGDNITMVFESIRNPVSKAEAFPRVVLPQGIWSNELEQYTTKTFEASGGELRMSYPGRTAQLAEIHWRGP